MRPPARLVPRFAFAATFGITLATGFCAMMSAQSNGDERVAEVRQRVLPKLTRRLNKDGLKPGSETYVRIFKESAELELWLRPDSSQAFQLFNTWKIACYSGKLGPKEKEGDMQAPEGFYATTRSLLNPRSRFHLSFNIGYPNTYDRSLKRTGGLIMVHGSNVSVGCFAMTDPVIEEIYLLVDAALSNGQPAVPVHVFPFRMTEQRLRLAKERPEEKRWLPFWNNLKAGYDVFEATHKPPQIRSGKGVYIVSPAF